MPLPTEQPALRPMTQPKSETTAATGTPNQTYNCELAIRRPRSGHTLAMPVVEARVIVPVDLSIAFWVSQTAAPFAIAGTILLSANS